MSSSKNDRLKKITNLLRFLLTVEDEEVIRSTLESVIEMLEEEIQ